MKSCPPEYWIWLQTALGVGAKTDELIAYFENPEKMYNAGSPEWRMSGLLTPRKIEKLKSVSPSQTKPIFDECRRRGYKIITYDDGAFPERLKRLCDIPLVLYTLGDFTAINDTVSIAMVGTRNASSYGIETAQRLSYSLAKAGVTVVSGGALGIDSEAHAGAMLANGRTVAVLGCGLSVNYLMENASLRRAVTRHGCLVTEHAPFSPASKVSFPIRNRLISGLTLGTVVVEAGKKSGSLITADKALEQGKDLFAVPGDIVRSSFDGTNHLISQGAKPIFSALDILSEYEYSYGELIDFSSCAEKITDIEYVDYRHSKSKKSAADSKVASPSGVNNLSREEGKASLKNAKSKNEKRLRGTKAEDDGEGKESLNKENEEKGALVKNTANTVVKSIENTQEEKLPIVRAINDECFDGVSKEAKRIYVLLLDGGLHIDDIAEKTHLPMKAVLAALTELELEGLAEQITGKKYIII